METTEEQRRRAEANRLAALEKRKRPAKRSDDGTWRLRPSGRCAASISFRVTQTKQSITEHIFLPSTRKITMFTAKTKNCYCTRETNTFMPAEL